MKSISRIFLSILAVLIILTLGSCDLFGPGILQIVNSGTLLITEVNIRLAGSSAWGADLLTSDISAGSSAQFEVNSASYDIQVYDSTTYFPINNVYIGSGDIVILIYDGSSLVRW